MANLTYPEISIVLPTYNERENINDLISEISLYVANHTGRSFEVIVVDDDSPDKTWESVEKQCGMDSKIKVIRRIGQKGLASAIWAGIMESRGDTVAWMDCDFSMPPYKIAELINKIYDGYDIAVGSRFIKGGKDIRGLADSWIAVILSRVMNYFITFTLGYSFKDYTSGFIAAKKNVFDVIKIKSNHNYGEYFIELIYEAMKSGYKIAEIPYYCLPRRAGYSKTGDNLIDYFKKGWKYILLTVRLKFYRCSKKQKVKNE